MINKKIGSINKKREYAKWTEVCRLLGYESNKDIKKDYPVDSHGYPVITKIQKYIILEQLLELLPTYNGRHWSVHRFDGSKWHAQLFYLNNKNKSKDGHIKRCLVEDKGNTANIALFNLFIKTIDKFGDRAAGLVKHVLEHPEDYSEEFEFYS